MSYPTYDSRVTELTDLPDVETTDLVDLKPCTRITAHYPGNSDHVLPEMIEVTWELGMVQPTTDDITRMITTLAEIAHGARIIVDHDGDTPA